MVKMRSLTLYILLSFLLILCIWCIVMGRSTASVQTMSISPPDMSSTKYWQDTTLQYVRKRNDLINNLVEGKYKNIKKYSEELKSFECSPLLDGDISLGEYILKTPGEYTEKLTYLNAECSEIRKLTKDEVIMTTKLNYIKNNMPVRCDYEIVYRNIDNKWLLSRLAISIN